MKNNLKLKDRQSGKSRKALVKLHKALLKGKNPVMFVHHATYETIINKVDYLPAERRVYKSSDWKLVLLSDPTIKLIVLDDYIQFPNDNFKEIKKFAKRNKIKIVGWSSPRGQ